MKDSYLKERRLLLVDDEPELLKLLTSILQDDGFRNLHTASNMKQGLTQAKDLQPELILLDVMLPDGDGFTLFQLLRQFTEVPVIFLTAKDQPVDKLEGLGLGADDYIVKPFLPQELLLRIHAVLRRCYKEDVISTQLDFCRIDFSRAEVSRADGTQLVLTATERTLLSTLARNAGRIVTIDTLCEAVWGENPFGYENSLMAHIRRIREKIEEAPSRPTSLLTVKGLGYKLVIKRAD
ncbi:response regulator transcription factor [Enterococcus sp. AZ072]|uniref:response regulator transcription factor n=1 Tax=unclassified Enterococcus TaxID=2608891 RepID=UPI003D28773E